MYTIQTVTFSHRTPSLTKILGYLPYRKVTMLTKHHDSALRQRSLRLVPLTCQSWCKLELRQTYPGSPLPPASQALISVVMHARLSHNRPPWHIQSDHSCTSQLCNAYSILHACCNYLHSQTSCLISSCGLEVWAAVFV